jgi:hypothetical protein
MAGIFNGLAVWTRIPIEDERYGAFDRQEK